MQPRPSYGMVNSRLKLSRNFSGVAASIRRTTQPAQGSEHKPGLSLRGASASFFLSLAGGSQRISSTLALQPCRLNVGLCLARTIQSCNSAKRDHRICPFQHLQLPQTPTHLVHPPLHYFGVDNHTKGDDCLILVTHLIFHFVAAFSNSICVSFYLVARELDAR